MRRSPVGWFFLALALALATTAVGYWPLGLALAFVALISFLTD